MRAWWLVLLASGVAFAAQVEVPVAGHTVAVLVEQPPGPGPHPLVVDLHGSGWHIENNRSNVLEWTRYGYIGMDVEYTQDVDSLSVEEVNAAIDWCKQHHAVSAVAIHGFSLGARVAWQTAITRPDLAGVSGMAGRVRLWDGRQPALDLVSHITCPVLIQQGQADQVVPAADAEAFAGALLGSGKPFECYLYASLGHRLDRIPWTRPRAAQFLERCFRPRTK
ncbi:MAG TPA: dienelactone hydrolase family protein [Candidatus Xenobia bacterium]